MVEKRKNVRLRPPVPMRNIVSELTSYDLGIAVYPPTSFNVLHSLPNKFFEFIQARLGVVTGPSPEMVRVLDKYECGVSAGSFEPKTVAELLNRLDEKTIMRFKIKSNEAAKQLCSEENMKVLDGMIQKIISANQGEFGR